MLEYISRGLSDKEAGVEMDISDRTIHQHMLHIMIIMKVSTRPHAVWKGFHWGVLIP